MALNALIGVNGIVWATPISDFLAMTVAILLFIPFWKKLKALIKGQEEKEKIEKEYDI